MLKIKTLIKKITRILIQSYYRVGVYALFTRLVLIALTIPLLSTILNNIISLWGNSASIKADISSLIISPIGLFFVFISALSILAIAIMEILGLSIMTLQTKNNEQHSLFILLWSSLKKLFKPGFFLFLITLFSFTLLTTLVIGLLYFPVHLIPSYLYYFILINPYLLGLFIFLMIASYFIVSRYLFVFSYLIKEETLKDALNMSVIQTKGRRIKIIGMLLVYQGIVFIGALLIYYFPFAISFILSFTGIRDMNFVSLISVMIFITKSLFTLLFYSLAYPLLISCIVTIDHHNTKMNQSVTWAESGTYVWIRHIVYRGGVVVLAAYLIVSSGLIDFRLPIQGRVSVVAENSKIDGIPSNTKKLLEYAISKGVNQVEVQVKMTRDGALVLSSSSIVKIDKDVYLIEDLLFDDVKRLTHDGEPFMTLEEAILISIGRIQLNIIYNPGSGDLVDPTQDLSVLDINVLQKIAYLVQIHRQANNTAILSVNNHVPSYLQLLVPNMQTGLITDQFTKIPLYVSTDISQIHHTILDYRHLLQMNLQGKQLYTYAIENEALIPQIINQGVDGVVTTKIIDAIRIVQTLQE